MLHSIGDFFTDTGAKGSRHTLISSFVLFQATNKYPTSTSLPISEGRTEKLKL